MPTIYVDETAHSVRFCFADGTPRPPYLPAALVELRVSDATWRAASSSRREDGSTPDPRALGLPVIVQLSPLEFFHLFTDAEYAAITAAAVASPALLGWLLKASGARYIDLADPLTAAGLGVLVAAGLLTSARMADVLANRPAPTA